MKWSVSEDTNIQIHTSNQRLHIHEIHTWLSEPACLGNTYSKIVRIHSMGAVISACGIVRIHSMEAVISACGIVRIHSMVAVISVCGIVRIHSMVAVISVCGIVFQAQ